MRKAIFLVRIGAGLNLSEMSQGCDKVSEMHERQRNAIPRRPLFAADIMLLLGQNLKFRKMNVN